MKEKIIRKKIEKQGKRIPLDTALWSVIHTHLLENGVVFPKSNWKTVGICYGAYVKIGEVLKEYFEPEKDTDIDLSPTSKNYY